MQLGVNVINRGPLARPEIITRFVQRAEELGFHSASVTDHIVIPKAAPDNYPYHPEGKFRWQDARDYYEPLALMAFLAGRTRRIRLGTSVLIVSYRNPVATAKFLATLDALAGGRLFLGVGTGWWEEEYKALGIPGHFAERGPRTDEYIRIFRELWTQAEPRFEGRFFRFGDLEFSPKPAQQGGIPIWIGGHTSRALKRVAELGDVWHPIGLRPPAGLEPPELAWKREELIGYAEARGRDGRAIPIAFRAPVMISDTQRATLIGRPGQIIADIRAYEAVGVTHLTCDLPAGSPDQALEFLERLGAEVLPQVQ
jgi:probable F420-dependent oxidoreductase